MAADSRPNGEVLDSDVVAALGFRPTSELLESGEDELLHSRPESADDFVMTGTSADQLGDVRADVAQEFAPQSDRFDLPAAPDFGDASEAEPADLMDRATSQVGGEVLGDEATGEPSDETSGLDELDEIAAADDPASDLAATQDTSADVLEEAEGFVDSDVDAGSVRDDVEPADEIERAGDAETIDSDGALESLEAGEAELEQARDGDPEGMEAAATVEAEVAPAETAEIAGVDGDDGDEVEWATGEDLDDDAPAEMQAHEPDELDELEGADDAGVADATEPGQLALASSATVDDDESPGIGSGEPDSGDAANVEGVEGGAMTVSEVSETTTAARRAAAADPALFDVDTGLDLTTSSPTIVPAPQPAPIAEVASNRSGKTNLRSRKVRRVIRHIDPWSVLVMSVLFHLVMFTASLLAGSIVWSVAIEAGTIANIESFIAELGDYPSFRIDGETVFRSAVMLAAVVTLASSVMVVLMSVVFNLLSDLIGGIRVTVVEEETVRMPRK